MRSSCALRRTCAAALWLIVSAVVGGVAPVTGAEVIDRVLARVGTRLILLSDVQAFRSLGLLPGVDAAAQETAIVARLIERDLMLAEVDRYALPEPEAAAVEVVMADLQGRLGGADLRLAFRLVGWSESGLRAVVRENLRIERYLAERFTAAAAPTDQEVLRYYRDHAGEFSRGGVAQPLEAVRDQIRAVLEAERRDVLIADWTAGLHRRADVVRLDTHE